MDGPGGWWILIEPEIHFVRDTEIAVPDLAGWRRDRLPSLPETAELLVSGHLARFALDEWQPLWSRSAGGGGLPLELELVLDRVELLRHELTGETLTVKPGVVVTATERRSRARNLAIAWERLRTRLEKLNQVPEPRIPTKPSRAARRRSRWPNSCLNQDTIQ